MTQQLGSLKYSESTEVGQYEEKYDVKSFTDVMMTKRERMPWKNCTETTERGKGNFKAVGMSSDVVGLKNRYLKKLLPTWF